MNLRVVERLARDRRARRQDRLVDPYFARGSLRGRLAAREALGVRGIRGIEDGLEFGNALLDAAVMHIGGREHAQRGVAMLVVVPAEEALAEGPGVLGRAERRGTRAGP